MPSTNVYLKANYFLTILSVHFFFFLVNLRSHTWFEFQLQRLNFQPHLPLVFSLSAFGSPAPISRPRLTMPHLRVTPDWVVYVYPLEILVCSLACQRTFVSEELEEWPEDLVEWPDPRGLAVIVPDVAALQGLLLFLMAICCV